MKIKLYWHNETDDVDLGEVYVDVLPPIGALITHVPLNLPPPREVCWRVVTMIIHPTELGSMNAVAHERGEKGQLGMYHVFVEPAEGPFHP